MKKYRILFPIVAVLLALSYLITTKHKSVPNGGDSTADTPAKRPLKSTNALLGQKIDQSEMSKARQNSAPSHHFPEKCVARFERFILSSIDDIVDDFENEELTRDPNCEEFEMSLIKDSFLRGLLEDCFDMVTSEKKKKCSYGIRNLRARLIDRYFSSENPKDLSASILANKVLAGLYRAFEDPKEHARVLQMTEELIQKEPSLYGAYKARALLNWVDGNNNFTASEKFYESIAACKQFDVEDPEIDDAQFFKFYDSSDTKLDEIKSVADSMLMENPKSTSALYNLAFVAFKKKNREESIRLLELARAYAPNDDRYRETLDKVRIAQFDEKIFVHRFVIRFEDKDL